jgi:inosose dehydratase
VARVVRVAAGAEPCATTPTASSGCTSRTPSPPGSATAKADDLDYGTATEPGRIWAEPGLGDVDLTACLAAFPADFAGDYMIEVDVPSLPLRECHQVAYDWALATLPLGARS